jgi:hypothetical protein
MFNPISKVTTSSRRAADRGVTMVVTLMAVVLLAMMVAYIYNLGHRAARRVEAQTGADAAAVAGAGWVARSLNTVAANNVATARLIAMVNVLDSLPLAVDFTYTDQTEVNLGDESAMYLALRHRLTLSIPDEVLRREMTRTRDQIGPPPTADDGVANADQEMLRQMDLHFKSNPNAIPNVTNYRAPGGGNGAAWRSMFALDAYSQTMMETLAQSAQYAAAEGGRTNLKSSGTSAAALLLPALPEVPWKRGSFRDFQRPVSQGLLPSGVDDKITNRGPWDTVYGWRWNSGGSRGGDYRADPPGYSPPAPVSGYRVYGPQEWMIERFRGTPIYSRLTFHLRRLSNIKMGYVWPAKRNDTTDATLARIVDPDWEIDVLADNQASAYPGLPGFGAGDNDAARRRLDATGTNVPLCDGGQGHIACSTARDYVQRHRTDVHESLYLVLDLYHREATTLFPVAEQYTGGNPSSDGSTSWLIQHGRMTPAYRGNPSPDLGPPFGPLRSNIAGVTSVYSPVVAPYAYRETIYYTTNPNVQQGRYANGAYPELGIYPIVDSYQPDGTPVYRAQTYYRTRYTVFVGVNVGLEKLVKDPYTGFNPSSASAPAPIDLDRTKLTYTDDDAKRKYLSFLGVAQSTNDSPLSRHIFDGDETHLRLTLAQANVFNNHSFDLWTQMWQAQLQPIDDYTSWTAAMQDPNVQAIETLNLTPDQLTGLQQYFSSLSTLAPLMSSH